MGAQGTTTLDFGVFPGASDASVAVTGQTAIVDGSLVEAWIRPVATADHTADEHLVVQMKIVAGAIIAGTGFTIYGFNMNPVLVPAEILRPRSSLQAGATATTIAHNVSTKKIGAGVGTPTGTRIYGTWTVAWVWN